jgi:hypothetical protein
VKDLIRDEVENKVDNEAASKSMEDAGVSCRRCPFRSVEKDEMRAHLEIHKLDQLKS